MPGEADGHWQEKQSACEKKYLPYIKYRALPGRKKSKTADQDMKAKMTGDSGKNAIFDLSTVFLKKNEI